MFLIINLYIKERIDRPVKNPDGESGVGAYLPTERWGEILPQELCNNLKKRRAEAMSCALKKVKVKKSLSEHLAKRGVPQEWHNFYFKSWA